MAKCYKCQQEGLEWHEGANGNFLYDPNKEKPHQCGQSDDNVWVCFKHLVELKVTTDRLTCPRKSEISGCLIWGRKDHLKEWQKLNL